MDTLMKQESTSNASRMYTMYHVSENRTKNVRDLMSARKVQLLCQSSEPYATLAGLRIPRSR